MSINVLKMKSEEAQQQSLLMYPEKCGIYQEDIIFQNKIYYRGLKEWKNEQGYLMDTCLTVQDRFKIYMDYFGLEYKD